MIGSTLQKVSRARSNTARLLALFLTLSVIEIEDRVAILTPTDRLLWRGYRDFLPSQHIKLLAEYARQKQLI